MSFEENKLFICRVRKEGCIEATSAKRQRLFSPAIRKSLPNKENNSTSGYRVVPRVPDDGRTSQCIRSQRISEDFEGFRRDYSRYTRGIRRERRPRRSGKIVTARVNARIHTSSWFPSVPSWFSSHPESPSRRRCSPPTLAPPGRTRPSDSTN